MNAWWQDRVVSFNMNKQLDLLAKIGSASSSGRV